MLTNVCCETLALSEHVRDGAYREAPLRSGHAQSMAQIANGMPHQVWVNDDQHVTGGGPLQSNLDRRAPADRHPTRRDEIGGQVISNGDCLCTRCDVANESDELGGQRIDAIIDACAETPDK